MSTLTRGKQMPPILNALNVQVSCLGNHDLDFGVEHFRSLIEKCNFPWLVANVIDKETGTLFSRSQTIAVQKDVDWETWRHRSSLNGTKSKSAS